MRLSEHLQHCVRFARFAHEYGLAPGALAELLALAEAASRAATRECNIPGYSADKARRRFEEMAKLLGFGHGWPGLYPILTRDGKQIMLPH